MNNKYSNRQLDIIKDNSKYTLVCAGAGTGKTTTIIGKINYLIKHYNIKEKEIICITFTNEAVDNLKKKLKEYNYIINCYTFHKFSLNILKNNYKSIISNNYLDYVIDEFFNSIYYNSTYLKLTLIYFKITFNNKNYKNKYRKIKKRLIDDLKIIIKRFIELLKTKGYTYENINIFYNKEKQKNNKALLLIIMYIYLTYEKELKSTKSIDFNDMINYSIEYIKNNSINTKTKYLIIDEFQDTSDKKFELIKEFQKKTNCNIFAVGDDFQSIYRFAGCNLNVFINFKNYFPNAKIYKLEETYRNSLELITIAGSFIMKNDKQIKKNMTSKKRIKKPIEIIYYKNLEKTLIKLIEKLYKNNNKCILILGRNNFDINFLKESKQFKFEKNYIIYLNKKDIKLRYLTVHKSKGLEEDNVIILNLLNNSNGFPNKRKNNYILKYVTLKSNEIKYGEERRLFYVALTRTKNKSYILTQKGKESIFIKELLKINKKYIKKTSL